MCTPHAPFNPLNPMQGLTAIEIEEEIAATQKRLHQLTFVLHIKQDKCKKHIWEVKYTPYDDGWGVPIDNPRWTRTCQHCRKEEETEAWNGRGKSRKPIWND